MFTDTIAFADQQGRTDTQKRQERTQWARTQTLALQHARYIAGMARACNDLEAFYFTIGSSSCGMEAFLSDPVRMAKGHLSRVTLTSLVSVGRSPDQITEQIGNYPDGRCHVRLR